MVAVAVAVAVEVNDCVTLVDLASMVRVKPRRYCDGWVQGRRSMGDGTRCTRLSR